MADNYADLSSPSLSLVYAPLPLKAKLHLSSLLPPPPPASSSGRNRFTVQTTRNDPFPVPSLSPPPAQTFQFESPQSLSELDRPVVKMSAAFSSVRAIRHPGENQGPPVASGKFASDFLGSAGKLRFGALSVSVRGPSARRRGSSSVVAVSDVVKEKKFKRSSSSGLVRKRSQFADH